MTLAANRIANAQTGYFAELEPQAPDALLALIKAFRDDPRDGKIDLGVGVYRDAGGGTPVFAAVKAAERALVETQPSKAYLGPEGDPAFVELLAPVALGSALAGEPRVTGLQTPGGTGALRLAAELIARTRPGATIWLGTPSWPNHEPIFSAAGLTVRTYRHFDVAAQRLCFGETVAALSEAKPGDVALLHGCCHNPTGADFTPDQWAELGGILGRRGVFPLIDLAYQGLGDDLEADAAGARGVIAACGEALVAYSCDKNFGLYRERVGALFVVGADKDDAGRALSNLLALARANWSMPPDHGAAVVRQILEDVALTRSWRDELAAMQARLGQVRARLGRTTRLAAVASQKGLFATLPLAPAQIAELRQSHAVYMAGSGRINVAGLHDGNIDRFIAALKAVG